MCLVAAVVAVAAPSILWTDAELTFLIRPSVQSPSSSIVATAQFRLGRGTRRRPLLCCDCAAAPYFVLIREGGASRGSTRKRVAPGGLSSPQLASAELRRARGVSDSLT